MILNFMLNPTFPEFKTVKEGFVPILENMLQRIVSDSSLSFRMNIEGVVLELTSSDSWTMFCEELLIKSREIALYFKVDNKFKLEGSGNNTVIRYG